MPQDPTISADGLLSVDAHRYGVGVVIVSLAGELDQSNVATARRGILGAIEDGCEILLIDLSELEFLDSSGIALLVAADEMCKDGTILRVVPSRSFAVTRVLRLTGVDTMLEIVEERPADAA